jgi:type VI secretion system secreted protein Hcp
LLGAIYVPAMSFMKHVQIICLAITLWVVAVTSSAQIALKIESPTINGELTDPPYKNQIEITAFSQGFSIPISSGGGGTQVGAPQPTDVVISKPLDQSSPELFLRSHLGTNFGKMTFSFDRPAGGTNETYYQVLLEDVRVTSMSQNSGGERPMESLSLNYGKIKWTYHSTSNGVPVSITRGWNYQTGQPYN